MFPIAAEKILSNVVWPAGQALYNEAAPMVKEWARGRFRKRVKGVLNSIDTYSDFSPDTPTKFQFRSPQGTPSRSMSTEAQQSESAGSANKRARDINGQNSEISPNDGVTVPAMFNVGRGAELGLVNKLIDRPISFKTGENPGPPRPHDPISASLQLYKPLRFNQAFAWKGVVPKSDFGSPFLNNRGYVHNVFRHYNYGVWGTSVGPYNDYAGGTAGWNKTLGPDSAQSRKLTTIVIGRRGLRSRKLRLLSRHRPRILRMVVACILIYYRGRSINSAIRTYLGLYILKRMSSPSHIL